MSEKAYRLGILVGRFQTLHLGHEDMFRKALAVCDTAAVFIGSAQESGTEKNPFSYEYRKGMLRTVFGDALHIYPLPDIGVGNNSRWGEYVLENVKKSCGALPDLLITGKEERRERWFSGPEGQHISELLVPKTIDVSASTLREFLLNDDEESFRRYMNPLLWDRYAFMRETVLSVSGNTETKSL